MKTAAKALLIAFLLGLITLLYLPNPSREDMNIFRTEVHADLVFLARIDGTKVRIIEAVGPKVRKEVYKPRDIYSSHALIKVLWTPEPACLISSVAGISNETYREIAHERGWAYITLCPIGDKEGFLGAGFHKAPQLNTLKIQEELAEQMEI